MALTAEQRFKIILAIPKDATVHEQILFLAANGIRLADTGWGKPSPAQQAVLDKGAITSLAQQKMDGGLPRP